MEEATYSSLNKLAIESRSMTKLNKSTIKNYCNKLTLICVCGAVMIRCKIKNKSRRLLCNLCRMSWKISEKSFMSCSKGVLMYYAIILLSIYFDN